MLVKFPRTIFGAAVVSLGIQHFILDHLAVAKPPPTSFQESVFLLAGFLYKIGSIALAAAILFNYKIKTVAFSLGVLVFSWSLFRHLPLVIANITDPGELNSMFMALAVAASSFIISDSTPGGPLMYRAYFIGNRGIVKLIGNFLYGCAMIVFGIQHILYAQFVASLIPSWIPGDYYWAYGTGLALVVAGISITCEWRGKFCSRWLGIMISLWIGLVHFPRIQENPEDHYEWTMLFQALIIASGAFVLRKNLSPSEEPIPQKTQTRTSKAKKRWHQRTPLLKKSEV